MELRHVKTFLALADELHFGRAAARLRVAQPAVSQTIRALEDELGVTLFARTRRRVELTAAGAFFREHARRALADLEQASTAARRADAGEIGRLQLGFTAVSALGPLPRILAAFRRRYPDVQLSVTSLGTAEQIEAIAAGRCDVGFTVLPPGDALPLRVEPVSDEPLMTLLPSGHRLARRRSLRFAELAGEPVILMSRRSESSLHDTYRRHCESAGFAPNIALEVDHAEAMLGFVAAGLGISHAPASILKLRFDGVTAIPLSPRMTAGVSAMWDPRTASPTALRFLELLRRELKRGAARAQA